MIFGAKTDENELLNSRVEMIKFCFYLNKRLLINILESIILLSIDSSCSNAFKKLTNCQQWQQKHTIMYSP